MGSLTDLRWLKIIFIGLKVAVIFFSKEMRNFVSGPLDVREKNFGNHIPKIMFYFRFFANIFESLNNLVLSVEFFHKTSYIWVFSMSKWLLPGILKALVGNVLRTPSFWLG